MSVKFNHIHILLVILCCLTMVKPSLANTTVYQLYVEVKPKDARVFIMNIKQKYHPGIKLRAGQYDLLVAHDDYYQFRQFVEINGNKTQTINNHKTAHPYSDIKPQLKGDKKLQVHIPINLQALPSALEQLKAISQRILKQGTQDVKQFLDQYYQKPPLIIKNAGQLNTDVFLKQAIEQLNRIAYLYAQIAERKSAILKVHEQQFSRLDTVQKRLENDIKAAAAEEQKYRQLQATEMQQIQQTDNALQQQRLSLSINMHKNMADTFQLKQQALQANAELQAQLSEKLRLHSQKIAYLLETLDIKAKFTEQAANLLSVNRNTATQLNQLTDTDTVQKIIQSIAVSEQAIQELLAKIETTNLQ